MTPIGHDANLATFLAAMASGRLHHAWLLTGPRGVGKAMFADAAAARLLAEAAGPPPTDTGLDVEPDHRIARLIAAGSHPDLIRLTRLENDRTKSLARNISVDQIRGLGPRFATMPSLSPRRVVVIDAIDDLEAPAANALLKSLEEPPAGTIFLLVSHAPARLLPTVRSRCRQLRFGRLDAADMARVLRGALPGATEEEIAVLAAIGAGSPGAGLRFAGLEIAALDAELDRLARDGDRGNARRSALAQSLSAKAAQPRYEAFLDRAPSRIAQEAQRRQGLALAAAIGLWEHARDLARAAPGLSLDPQTTVFEIAGLVAALAPDERSVKG
ncbi:AAA family ATPase [Sphingomonas sp. 1P06PA]|uniref:AAA family ATPase n=1 Tax=Sphingomonas sp. 1P06PA TaxID=554121 RepID=UPI0039A60A39